MDNEVRREGTFIMKLEFSGTLDSYGGGLCDVSPTIDGTNIINEINKTFPSDENVTVYFGAEPIKEGPLWACHGFGGTEVTPAESPMIIVGDRDLIRDLNEYDGREVLLVIESKENK